MGNEDYLRPDKPINDGREKLRLEFYLSQNIEMSAFTGSATHSGYLLDLSIDGACFVLRSSDQASLVVGKELALTFQLPGEAQPIRATGFVCWFAPFKENLLKVGVKFDDLFHDIHIDKSKLLKVPSHYPVIGYLYKNYFYYEKSIFSVLEIKHNLIKIAVKDKDIVFYPGMTIELLFSLQSSDEKKILCKVLKASMENNEMYLYASIESWPTSLEKSIINHLIQDSDISLEAIRNSGFKVREISNNFRFRFVKNNEDYNKVLDLRFNAYSNAGKIQQGKNASDMKAPLDGISRIILATHGGKPVASVAMAFPDSDNALLDTERGLGERLPSWMPDRKESIEISRLCTDVDYRRGDLLVRMFEHIYRVFASSKRKYIITSTDEKLWPLYKNLGFSKTGLKYNHPYLNNLPHEIIFISVNKGIMAQGIALTRWNYLYRNMTFFMLQNGEISLNKVQLFKLKILSFIGYFLKIRMEKKY